MARREQKQIHYLFEAGGLGPEVLLVADWTGSESISQLFRVDLNLISADPDIAFEDVLNKPATFTIVRDDGEEKIHGIVVDFECGEPADHEKMLYRAVLAPRAWRLGLTSQSRVFQNKDVKEIVTEVFKGAELASGDAKWSLKKSYPKRDYVVQYQESDLDFVCRLLEHEGIFFLFDHFGDKDLLVISDDPGVFKTITAPDEIVYRPAGGLSPVEAEVVLGFTLRERMVTGKVRLRDYNYRTPDQSLEVESQINSKATGFYYAYGDHFKDVSEGERIARVRNEEIESVRMVARGVSTCRGFRAGYKFALAEHVRDKWNQDYLITGVTHRGSQSAAPDASGEESRTYENEFACIPASMPYRPPRVTPKPKIDGVMHGVIDSAGSDQYADIDDEGRYRVKLPFDIADASDGQRTKAMRMAQPYAGADYGMHFPLHKGTEVLLTHMDGDCDRPIIAAAVPNPAKGSPVKGGNKTQSMIRTGGNNEMRIDDAAGAEQIFISTPHSGTKMTMGAPNSPGPGFGLTTTAKYFLKTGSDSIKDIGANYIGAIGGNMKWDVVGDSNTTIKGKKSEMVMGSSTGQVLGSKIDTVVGTNSAFTGGVKQETVIGAIINIGKAVKIEKQSGPTFFENPITKIDAKSMIKMTAGAAMTGEAPQIMFVGDGKVHLQSNGTDVVVNPGGVMIEGKKVMINAPDGIHLTAGGSKVIILPGGITIEGSKIEIKAGGDAITLSGGITAKSATVKVNGKLLES